MENMENNIQRARMALGAGVSEEEVAANIQEQESNEIAYLAIQAAKLLLSKGE